MTPEGWSTERLGSLLERIYGGGTPSRTEPSFWGGEIPWASVKDMKGSRLVSTQETITVAGLESCAASLVPPGAIVVATRMNVGAVVRAVVSTAINQDLKALLPSSRLDRNFLFYSLVHRKPEFEAKSTGSTVRGFRQEVLLELTFRVPPLPEQRKIAAILSSVDDAIEATQAVIDQLQVVKKAMMAELLTRGLPGRHARFKETEIGEVPKGWEVTTIGAVCDRMFVGIAQAATHAYVAEAGVPLIRTTNVRPNRLRTDEILRISTEFAEEMSSKALRAGDVLSARTGYPGTSVVVPPEFDGAQCFTLLVSRPGPRLGSRFLCHLMNSDVGARIVREGQAGGAQQNLNVGVFEKAHIALPSRLEQDAIVSACDSLFAREEREVATREGLQALKAALLSVLLTGEVRVTPDPEGA